MLRTLRPLRRSVDGGRECFWRTLPRATGSLLGGPRARACVRVCVCVCEPPPHLRRMATRPTARPESASGDLLAGSPPDRRPTSSLGSHDLDATKASLNY